MRCEICGREYEKENIVEWLDHRICVYCMGFYKERTKRGPPQPPKPEKPKEKEKEKKKPEIPDWYRRPGGIPQEYRRPPSIGPKGDEEKESFEEELEAREAGPPETGPPEEPREEKGIVERIVDAIKSAFEATAETIKSIVEKVREWFT